MFTSSKQHRTFTKAAGKRTLVRAAVATAATVAVGLGGLAPASPAHARPGAQGPYVTFMDTMTTQGVKLTVGYPQQVGDSGLYETHVKVCNVSQPVLQVGPETFSYSRNDQGSWYYSKRNGLVHTALPSTHLQPGACASGSLVNSKFEPYQLAFHQPKLGVTIDIIPATEWEGTYEPAQHPKAEGATHFPGDYTGDRVADVYGKQTDTTLYRTVPGPRLTNLRVAFPGDTESAGADRWASKIGDVDRNGMADVLVADARGRLLLFRSMEGGRLALPYEVGRGWQNTSLFGVLPGNDQGAPTYLVARNAKNELVRYTLTERGLRNPVVIGTGWGSTQKLFSVGDVNGDGIADLLAVRADGQLNRYALNSSGKIVHTAVVGRGWQTTTKVTSPGDLNKDGNSDMIAIRKDGSLYAYYSWGNGKFSQGYKIGQNWQNVETIA